VPRRSVLASPRLDLPSKHLLRDGSTSVTDGLLGWVEISVGYNFLTVVRFPKNETIRRIVESTALFPGMRSEPKIWWKKWNKKLEKKKNRASALTTGVFKADTKNNEQLQ